MQHQAHVSVNGTKGNTTCLKERGSEMAHAIAHHTGRLSLADHIAAYVASYKEARARRAVYDRTFGELNAMTDRDLADIGLARVQIEDIAYEAAYGK